MIKNLSVFVAAVSCLVLSLEFLHCLGILIFPQVASAWVKARLLSHSFFLIIFVVLHFTYGSCDLKQYLSR